jgi:hypothetical protein
MGRCSVLVSKEYKTDAEAIAAWNTRTDSIPSEDALIRAALEAAAKMIEGTAYTSHGDGRSLEPVSAGLAGMDMHHATIAATIRAMKDNPDALAAIKAKAEVRE